MNPYLFTLIFLLLLGALTSSEVVRFSENQLGTQIRQNCQNNKQRLEAVRALTTLDDFRGKKTENKDQKTTNPIPTPNPIPDENEVQGSQDTGEEEEVEETINISHPVPLRFSLMRPPNNGRLNFYLLLNPQEVKNYPISLYEVAARLMRTLYQDAPFYFSNGEYLILDALLEQKSLTDKFQFPEELSNLNLGNEQIHMLFFHMLKGSADYPSLLNYITFDRNGTRYQKKVNLMSAPPCVLEALLDNPVLCAKLRALRDSLVTQVLDQEANRLHLLKTEGICRKDITTTLQLELESISLDTGVDYDFLMALFDLTLGKMGNILLIEEPHSGVIRREKYVSKRKNITRRAEQRVG